jgi:hypothetical protein
MAQKLRINPASASNKEFIKIALKCGFLVFHGAKHDKIKNAKGEFVTLVPRHKTINSPLAIKIIQAMNANGADINS